MSLAPGDCELTGLVCTADISIAGDANGAGAAYTGGISGAAGAA